VSVCETQETYPQAGGFDAGSEEILSIMLNLNDFADALGVGRFRPDTLPHRLLPNPMAGCIFAARFLSG
jgi:hypothetical protein